jgi:hypothetical protein
MIQKKRNPGGLPYGAGSMQIRGTKWWLIYRDFTGKVVQESSHTADQNEARRMLLERALRTAEARLAVLREMADGDSGTEEIRSQNRSTELSGARRSGAGRGSVRANSMGRTQSQRAGETRR